jgi:hypothetical protein
MRTIAGVLLVAAVAWAAFYLHDPPWIGDLTYGFRPWALDERGERYRWTTGRGSFFVPGDAISMTLRLRSHQQDPPNPIAIDIRVDDRALATVVLPDRFVPDPSQWVVKRLLLPRRPTRRRFRRVDVRVRHSRESYYLGVNLGEITIERPGR